MRNDNEGVSIIDLTLANQPFREWSILDENHATGFDHVIIEWQVYMAEEEGAGGTQVVGWNLAVMSQEDKKLAK